MLSRCSLDEFKDILGEIGEHKLRDDEDRLKKIWKAAEKDEFGEIGFRAMMVVLEEWKAIKMNHRGILAKYVFCVCLYMYERRYAPRVGRAGRLIGAGDPGVKVRHFVLRGSNGVGSERLVSNTSLRSLFAPRSSETGRRSPTPSSAARTTTTRRPRSPRGRCPRRSAST